jgi:hypothetical protein
MFIQYLYKVSLRRSNSESVCDVWVGKVVHLVVHYYASGRREEAAAETEIISVD